MGLPAIATLKPAAALPNTGSKGFRRALRLFQEAAQRVPAYKDFLKKNGINPALIRTMSDFSQLPIASKQNYISQYSLSELSWDGSLVEAKCVSTSSGSTGVPFYWPRGYRQDVVASQMIQKMFEDIFDTGSGSSLVVNSFALGPWTAGFEFYNAVQWTSGRGSHLTIVTPGIDRAETVNEIRKLSPHFNRVIIAGYPPFIKDIIDHGILEDIDWSKLNVRLLMGGEAVSEIWKDRLLEKIGAPKDLKRIIVEYGMAESTMVANDSPVASVLRRALPTLHTADAVFPAYDDVVGLYQYYPTARYFEAQNIELVLTSDAGLPLIRYETRDTGGVMSYDDAIQRGGQTLKDVAKEYQVDLTSWQLPFVYLMGRKDFSISFYALNIYVENIKRALESTQHTRLLSGLFTMSVGHTESMDQKFEIVVELERGVDMNSALAPLITDDVVNILCRVNAEYAKLHASLGARARPSVSLVSFGMIETIPGRKHKWFKKS